MIFTTCHCAFVPNTLDINSVNDLKMIKQEQRRADVGNLVQARSTSKPMPTVTVDIAPSTSEYEQSGKPDTLFYPLNKQGFLFNFSCTIKHPSYRYKMTIVREQTINGKVETLNLLDDGGYDKNPEIKDDRIVVTYSEPDWLDAKASFIRVTVLISSKHQQQTNKIN
jgi:hypothetical protein